MNTSCQTFLSIVIPCFNEARRLPTSLDQLAAHCRSFPFRVEIVVIVELSTDDSAEVAGTISAREPAVRVIASDVRRGKGYAIRTGVRRSRGEIVFTMDADLSVPVGCIDGFLRYFDARPEVNVLVGNRQHADSHIAVRQSLGREFMGQCFNRFVRLMVGGELRVTQCGFKAYRRQAARAIFSRQSIDGFAADVEILMLANRLGFIVQDLPVQWYNSPDSRVRMARDTWSMLRDVATVQRRVNAALRQNPPTASPPNTWQ